MITTAIFGIVSVKDVRLSPAVPDTGPVQAALAGVNKQYGEAYRRGDSSLFLNCYTPDAWVMAANMPILSGCKGLLLFYNAAYQTGIRNVVFHTVELFGLTEETVTEQGMYELFDASERSLGKGKYLVLWKKTAAGWKIHRDMFNADAPAE